MALAAGSIGEDVDGAFQAARDRAFRKARRHTVVVRVLRVLLPVTAVGLLASYSLFVRQTYKIQVGKGEISFGQVSVSTEALKAFDPRYEGFNKDGGRYVIVAKSAEQDFKQTGPIKLDAIDGQIFDAANAATRLKARRGDFFDKTGVLELYERIDIDADSGMKARLTRASVLTKESKVVTEEPVAVEMPGGTVHGQRMVLEQKKRQVLFDGGVTTRLKQDETRARPSQPRPETGSGFAAGTGPIDINSRQLAVDDNAKTAVFTGDVLAKQGEATLATPELVVFYEGNSPATGAKDTPGAKDGGAPVAKGMTPGSNKVRLIRAKQNVVLVNGNQRATGSAAEFDQHEDVARLVGPVVVTQEPDRKATADDAVVDNRNDTVLMTGATVVLTQGRNVLRGRRMLVNRKLGTMQMTAPSGPWGAAARISARLYSGDADQQQAAPKKRPAPKAATPENGSLLPTVQRDPNEPIDIDAVSLDVDDNTKTATFRGDVVAVQGPYTIRTVELVATYTGESGLAFTGASQPAAAADAKKQASELRRVEARQRVLITSKDGQKATGEKAVFDPKTNMATITGDVVLTRGDGSIARGPKATVDMNSGLFAMASSEAASGAASPTSRPSLLIYPEQAKEAAKNPPDKSTAPPSAKSAPATGAASKTSGWSTETDRK